MGRSINPAENGLVAVAALGEGWHNYHHSFPWDYRTAELGGGTRNLTTAFIDLMARYGAPGWGRYGVRHGGDGRVWWGMVRSDGYDGQVWWSWGQVWRDDLIWWGMVRYGEDG